MRLSSYIPMVIAIVLAAVASVVAAIFAVDKIERRAEVDIRLAMVQNGHDWVNVAADGLQVSLAGIAPDEATRFNALSIAGTIVDGTRLLDTMEVAAVSAINPPRFSIEILRNDDGVSLIGLVPSELDREDFISKIRRIAGETPVTDLLEMADFPSPDGWTDAVDYSLVALRELPRSKISMAADSVTVTAITESEDQKRRIETDLARRAPDSFALVMQISAPRPLIAPFSLRFLIDQDGARFDSCSADTVTAREKILSAASAAGMQGKAECAIGLGVPSTAWSEAARVAIEALANIGSGTVTFSDTDVTLIAADTTEQSVFDRQVGELERALPAAFSLHSVLPEKVVVDGTGDGGPGGVPEFVATLAPEGDVQLRGRITDDLTRRAIESFAHARFGLAKTYAATRLDDALPEGWPLRVLASLEALSLLNNGSVVVQPDYVEIKGQTGNKNAQTRISQLLSQTLGDGSDFAVNVTYKEDLDPVAALPTPEECVADINAALDARKITFAPSSTDIEVEALETVDKIAGLLRECQSARIEIGGHTDSQGRETMNERLSQARADAVLNAIMARRVLTSNITARGYGEATPIGDNETEEGRELNRRIEFRLITDEDLAKAAAEEEAAAETSEASSEDPSTETETESEAESASE